MFPEGSAFSGFARRTSERVRKFAQPVRADVQVHEPRGRLEPSREGRQAAPPRPHAAKRRLKQAEVRGQRLERRVGVHHELGELGAVREIVGERFQAVRRRVQSTERTRAGQGGKRPKRVARDLQSAEEHQSARALRKRREEITARLSNAGRGMVGAVSSALMRDSRPTQNGRYRKLVSGERPESPEKFWRRSG